MAKNYRISGKRIHVTPAAAVAAGVLVRQQGFIGIPMNNAASGQSVSFALEGVWGMTYADYAGLEQTISKGTILYWDTSASKLSIGIGSGDFVAVKVVDTKTLTTDGAFDGLLLPQGRSDTVEQI